MTCVLVVDDNDTNLAYLDALLSGHGFEVTSARHGAEALVLARQSAPDVVISDLLMPVMDGYTLLRQWRADSQLRAIPFIVYTATYTEAQDERLALDLGADAFILKPTEPDEFLDRLREVRSRGVTARPVADDEDAPAEDDPALLKSYSSTLIRKLEKKSLQLERTNQELLDDIEARERIEVALRASEAENRRIIESMPQLVWIATPDGRNQAFNQQWLDYTGLTLDTGLERGWELVIHPDHLAESEARWQASVASGAPFEMEYRLRRGDGAHRWMLGRAVALRDDTGAVVKWFGTCTDIEDLKVAEAQVREQARLLDQTQDAIVVHDRDGRIVYWNQGATRVHGWSTSDAVGKHIEEVHCPDLAQLGPVMDALDRTGEWSGELRLVTRDGIELVVEGRWTRLPEDGPNPGAVLAVNTDVTDRRRIEAQFLRAQRLESIGTLAGGIAHDLNNVLAPIVTGAGLLRRPELDAAADAIIDTIVTSALRGTDLVRQVLSYARGIDGARVPVQLGDVVTEVLTMTANMVPPGVDMVADVADDLREVVGDPTQLHQVVLNLCVNARHAVGAHGTVTIALHNDADTPSRPGDPEPQVVLRVTDDGSGIPTEVIDRVFDPFFTTKAPSEGTGLGLATVAAIVGSHGGSIDVESRSGSGSTFEVRLPVRGTPTPTRAAAATTPGRAARPSIGRTVLLVDDERAIVDTTRRVLEAAGYEVIATNLPAEAEALFAEHRDEIDLVLTDASMPGLHGDELLERIRRQAPDIAAVVMSGVPRPSGVHTASLAKPFSSDQLLAIVEVALAPPTS